MTICSRLLHAKFDVDLTDPGQLISRDVGWSIRVWGKQPRITIFDNVTIFSFMTNLWTQSYETLV